MDSLSRFGRFRPAGFPRRGHGLYARIRRRGAAAVELAIVAPLLFLLLFGVVEFGRLVMVRQSLTNAARVGCRRAALATTGSANDAEVAVRNYLQAVIPDAEHTVSVDVRPTNLADISAGTPITVEVAVNVADIRWLPGGFLNSGALSMQSTQRRE
jgi:Flp pilus assembly protein TadG